MVVFKYSDDLRDVVVYTEDDNKYCLSVDFHSNGCDYGHADLELGYTIGEISDALGMVDMMLPYNIRVDIFNEIVNG